MDNYISLSEAVKRTHLLDTTLSELAETGKIKSVMTNSQLLLRESDVLAHQPRSNFNHLTGQPIGIAEAARKYGLKHQTLSRWKDRGYIRVLGQEGQKILLDEGDVAYMADWYCSNPGSGKRTDLNLRK